MYSASTFIHFQHLSLFTYIYIFKTVKYLFTTLLSIQKLFIHSTVFLFIQDLLHISLTHGSDILPAADEQGAAKKHNWSSLEVWKDTDHICCSWRKRAADLNIPRLCLITLWLCSTEFLQIFFAYSLLILELQIRENIKKFCTQSEKFMVSSILWWPRGIPVLLLNGESFYSKLIFSCILGTSVYEKYFFGCWRWWQQWTKNWPIFLPWAWLLISTKFGLE